VCCSGSSGSSSSSDFFVLCFESTSDSSVVEFDLTGSGWIFNVSDVFFNCVKNLSESNSIESNISLIFLYVFLSIIKETKRTVGSLLKEGS
jgi:hypothetical protein